MKSDDNVFLFLLVAGTAIREMSQVTARTIETIKALLKYIVSFLIYRTKSIEMVYKDSVYIVPTHSVKESKENLWIAINWGWLVGEKR